ncbi:hypothetical protein [Sphingobacterium hungaricum]
MVIIFDKNNLKYASEILLVKLKITSQKKGNLSKHFGMLKRNLDGLSYQMKVRENES